MCNNVKTSAGKVDGAYSHHMRRASASMQMGFSLVEIMVGMVMAMLAMVVIYQMFLLFETQKRTTTGGNDAQNNLSLALHALQLDIEQAGYGFSNSGLLGCSLNFDGGIITMSPVTINPAAALLPAGDANTDSMLVFYGDSNSIGEGNDIQSQSGVLSYTMQLATAFKKDDRVIATATPCAPGVDLLLDKVDTAPEIGSTNLSTVTVKTGVVVPTTASMFNLGKNPKLVGYAVRNGKLTVCDYTLSPCTDAAQKDTATVWQPIADNVVSMRLEYGRDVAKTPKRTAAEIKKIVNATTPPSPLPNYQVDTYDQKTPTTSCGWMRTTAIRMVLVTRGEYERDVVTPNVPTWSDSANFPIKFSNTDWQNYRYRAAETIVPIRNISWIGEQENC